MGKRRKLTHPKPAKPHHGGGGGGGEQKHNKGKPGGRDSKQQQQQPQRNASSSGPSKPPRSAEQPEPTIPFAPEDKILLVGEGDLSFAASLVEHHYCADVTATVLESDLDELTSKYPHVLDNVAKIEAEDGKVLYNVDAAKMGPFVDKKGKDGTGVMDRIIFNFPHVGGKSTDVNRQVRYNQELLVSFFRRALLSLAPGGTIIVTLFEGEPYTLWNIRDLGRHSGLQVERSFRFQAAAYPGYHHARTLGVVRNKASGEVGGGWKGEERAARSYVFVRKDDEQQRQQRQRPSQPPQKSGNKRARGRDDDSSDGD